MKNFLFIFLISVPGLYNRCDAQVWTPLSGLPAQNPGGGYTFSIGNNIYLHTGDSFFVYNPAVDTWTPKANFPDIVMGRQDGVAFSINGKGYMGFGTDPGKSTGRLKKDLWAYDPVADNWARKADLPALPRFGAACFVINNKAYIGGGYCTLPVPVYLNDLWEYDPATDNWTQKHNIPVNLVSPIAFSANGKGYLTCGVSASFLNFSNATYGYNPVTDIWSAKSAFPGIKRLNGTAFVINGIAYVGTGATIDSGNNTVAVSNEIYTYDVSADTWKQEGYFPGSARWDAVSVVINNKAYFGTGATKVGSPFSGDWWTFNGSLSVAQNQLPGDIKVFPNPAADIIHVKIPKQYQGKELKYSIINLAGQKIAGGICPVDHAIHISQLSTGLYLLRITSGVDSLEARIKIQKN